MNNLGTSIQNKISCSPTEESGEAAERTTDKQRVQVEQRERGSIVSKKSSVRIRILALRSGLVQTETKPEKERQNELGKEYAEEVA